MKNTKDHERRKNQLLDIAQQLFYRKGYENTSVADIITAAEIAKGTFYHYFKTKEELLNLLIERLVTAIKEQLELIIQDKNLDACEKLNKFFIDSGNYKIDNKEAVIIAITVFYKDENLRMREKLIKSFFERATPMLTSIIMQGVSEGHFHTDYGTHAARLILTMGLYLREEFSSMIVHDKRDKQSVDLVVTKCMMYQDAIERILGAPKGSIQIFSRSLIERFFT